MAAYVLLFIHLKKINKQKNNAEVLLKVLSGDASIDFIMTYLLS